jgi:hypothetical protein
LHCNGCDAIFYGMVWYMVWYGAPPTPRQCVLSLRVVASCSVDPSGHSGM